MPRIACRKTDQVRSRSPSVTEFKAMLLLLPSAITLLSFFVVSALPLNSLSFIPPGSVSTSLTRAATSANGTAFQPACLGRSYGYDLSLESCADALLLVNSSSTALQTYGVRGTGQFDVMLPRRYISRE